MRKKGIGLLGALSLLVLVVMALFSDRLLERLMEQAGSTVVGAKVEFDGVDLSVFTARLRWRRLRVTNPRNTWTNLVETGRADVDLVVEPLFYSRFVISNMQLDGIRLNTPRRTNGALPGMPTTQGRFVERVQERLQKKLEEIPSFRILAAGSFDVDSIIDAVGLETPDKLDSAARDLDARTSAWDERLSKLPGRDEVQEIRSSLDTVARGSLEQPEDIARALGTLNDIRQRYDSLKSNIDSARTALQSEINTVRTYGTQANQWVESDLERLSALAGLPEMGPAAIAEILFGEVVVRRVQSVLTWIGVLRYYGEKVKAVLPEKEPKPPRRYGQDIFFNGARSWPKFWLQRASVSGEFVNGIFAEGVLTDVTTQMQLTGRPTILQVAGTRADGASVRIGRQLDYTGETAREQLSVEAAQVPLSGLRIGVSPLLGATISSGIGRLSGQVELHGERFRAGGTFSGSSLSFAETQGQEKDTLGLLGDIGSTLRESVDRLSIEAAMSMAGNSFSFDVSSSIADDAAALVKQRLGSELSARKAQLRAAIGDRVGTDLRDFRTLLDKRAGEAQARVAEVDNLVDETDRLIKEKRSELEARMRGTAGERLRKLL